MNSKTDVLSSPSMKKRKCSCIPRYIWGEKGLDTVDGKRTYYRELIKETDGLSEIFRVGDIVFVRSSILSRPYIGEIVSLFEDADGMYKTSTRWFYRKQDVAKKDQSQVLGSLPNEVFYSDFSDENNVDLILGFCKIQWVDYRLLTADFKQVQGIFNCRYRYLPFESKVVPHDRICIPSAESSDADDVIIIEMPPLAVEITGSSSFSSAVGPSSPMPSSLTAKSPVRCKKVIRMCTACSEGVAESIHPVLKVDLCGVCYKAHLDSATLSDIKEEQACFWCNSKEGLTSVECDSCQKSFCEKCIKRNFGKSFYTLILKIEPWSCFVCDQTPLVALQLVASAPLLNMERVFASIPSPTEHHYRSGFQATAAEIHAGFCPETEETRLLLMQNPGALKLASIICKYMDMSAFPDLILPFLTSRDLAVVRAVSKGLHKMMSIMTLTPGLFETEFGRENRCKLFPHQMLDLKNMKLLENKSKEFGALRGGIFADDPGLGKTITSLALITSTAGQLPSCPKVFWNIEKINEIWRSYGNSQEKNYPFCPLLSNAMSILMKNHDNVSLRNIRNFVFSQDARKAEYLEADGTTTVGILNKYPSVESFERDVTSVLRETLSHNVYLYDKACEEFRLEMREVKRGLDPSKRSFLHSAEGLRIQQESAYRSSSCTLVIVPLSLLEHWFEQISRMLNLSYLSGNPDGRGVVFIDGLGDIVDIQVPLPKTDLCARIDISVESLAQHTIVLTTFERCMSEFGKIANSESNERKELDPSKLIKINSKLHKIRWLRLIVDEGHELGNFDRKFKLSKAMEHVSNTSAYISTLAAERRWVMTGTPITGAVSSESLIQLHHLFSFLRHQTYGSDSSRKFIKDIVDPFLRGSSEAFGEVVKLLEPIFIRHTKKDLNLYNPIYSTVILRPKANPYIPHGGVLTFKIDYSLASYIADIICEAKERWTREGRPLSGQNRRPKAIVFGENVNLLNGVGSVLYYILGDSDICEHWGEYRSCELSRFRQSRSRYRICQICGFQNSVAERVCGNTLAIVRYLNNVPERTVRGKCLCSDEGCQEACRGFPNAMVEEDDDLHLIDIQQIDGWHPSKKNDLFEGQQIDVLKMDAVPVEKVTEDTPYFQRRGTHMGAAQLVKWNQCGKVGSKGWHKGKILDRSPWKVTQEDASILLLSNDGTTGLDLSFCTHIFLLDHIKDPALQSQIVSRANRMGATGSVEVVQLLVKVEKEDETVDNLEMDDVNNGDAHIDGENFDDIYD